MKILNDMHFELNWIEFQFNEEKWDANWWRRYWKFACEYGVGKKPPKQHKFEKIHFNASLLGNGLNNLSLELFKWQPMTYGT